MSLPYAKGSLTSQQAAQFMTPYAGNARERVYLAILNAGPRGLTDEEIGTLLQMKLSTVHPRRGELQKQSLIQAGPVQRKTTSGCNATVWMTTGFPYNANAWKKKTKQPTVYERVAQDFKKGMAIEQLTSAYSMSRFLVERSIRDAMK